MAQRDRYVFVYNKTKETFLAFRVKIADSIFSRLVGLLGKRSLTPDSGVWICPANAIHTVGMLFSITRPNFRAESVLELPSHSIFKSRTEVGDQLVIERYEAKKRPQPGPVEISEVQLASSPAPSQKVEDRNQMIM